VYVAEGLEDLLGYSLKTRHRKIRFGVILADIFPEIIQILSKKIRIKKRS